MSWLHTFAAQTITVIVTALLIAWFAKRARRPAPLVDGWHIVKWPLPLRLLSVALSAMMLWAAIVLMQGMQWAPTASTLVVVFVLACLYLMLFFWRSWVKYNGDTLISSTTWGRPRQFRLSDLQFTGEVGARGHEYATPAQGNIYINSYQTGGRALIESLAENSNQ
jgi:membrane-associated HD superfamily phosphohydrolase